MGERSTGDPWYSKKKGQRVKRKVLGIWKVHCSEGIICLEVIEDYSMENILCVVERMAAVRDKTPHSTLCPGIWSKGTVNFNSYSW